MPEQKRVTGGRREDKQPQERKLEPATEQAVERAAPAAWPGGPPLLPDDIPLQTLAARLGDTRFQTAQRQAMAVRVRRVSGNAVLQRTIVQALGDRYRTVQAQREPTRAGPTTAGGQAQAGSAGAWVTEFTPPPGPYRGRRKRNDLMDPFEFKQNIFGPGIFKRCTKRKALWAPLQGLIHTYWVKNSGDQKGIRVDSPELKKAAWNLLEAVTTPREMAVIRNNTREKGEDTALVEAVFVEFRKYYPPANRLAKREWRRSNFRLFHEWAAVKFGFVSGPYAYWAK